MEKYAANSWQVTCIISAMRVAVVSVLYCHFFAAFLLADFVGPREPLPEHEKSRTRHSSPIDLADKEGREVDRMFRSVFSARTPGCTVAVERDGLIVLQKAYGSSTLPNSDPERSRVPMSPSTRMRVASITKPMVATAVLMLRRRLLRAGKGDLLNKKLGEIYPFFKDRIGFSAITVRQLLEHTSSLIRDFDENQVSEKTTAEDVPQILSKMRWGAFIAPEAPHMTKTLMAGKTRIPRQRPGVRVQYSNVGYMLLADILSQECKTAGMNMDWRDFMRTQIFEPLGMTSTSPDDDPAEEQKAGRLALSYNPTPRRLRPAGFSEMEPGHRGFQKAYLGAGGMDSTAADLLRFSQAIDENKLLTKEDQKLAFTPSDLSKEEDSEMGLYGLGWAVSESGPPRLTIQEHSGEVEGFSGDLLRAQRQRPRCNVSVAVLCNFASNSYQTLNFDPRIATSQIVDIYCPPNPVR